MSMRAASEYDKFPTIPAQAGSDCAWQGWNSILECIRGQLSKGARRIAIECYPGVFEDEMANALGEGLNPSQVIRVSNCYKPAREIEAMTSGDLTDDPVFGKISQCVIEDF